MKALPLALPLVLAAIATATATATATVTVTATAVAVLAGTAASRLAAAAPQGVETTGDSQGFVLEAGEHDLLEVIAAAGKYLGRNYIVHPEDLPKQGLPALSLQKTMNLDALGCEDVVSQLAWAKGFLLSPLDAERGLFQFIAVNSRRQTDIRALHWTPKEVLRRPNLRTLVSTIVSLEHLAPAAAQGLVHQAFLGSAAGRSNRGVSPLFLIAVPVPGSQALILRGICRDVADAIGLVAAVDAAAGAAAAPAGEGSGDGASDDGTSGDGASDDGATGGGTNGGGTSGDGANGAAAAAAAGERRRRQEAIAVIAAIETIDRQLSVLAKRLAAVEAALARGPAAGSAAGPAPGER